jgi:hypothetical protein
MKRAIFMRAALLCCLAAGGPAKAGFTTLDDPSATGGTYAWGIDGRNIVGYYTDKTGDHGFLYNGSSYTTLDDSLGTDTVASGISGNSIVGSYFDGSIRHGFLYQPDVSAVPAPSSLTLLGTAALAVLGYRC